MISCSRGKKYYTDAVTCRDSVPGMTTYNIVSLISDSGVMRYKIVADRWDVYDRLTPSMWAFEEGVYLERFADSLTIDATVKADTAYYYDKKKLWELRSNVHIENLQGVIFDTDLLFWDQDREKVWSDRYIRIQEMDRIIIGYGFTSNQQFDRYAIRNTEGVFPIDEEKARDTSVNEVVADSLATGVEPEGSSSREIDAAQAVPNAAKATAKPKPDNSP